MFKSYDFVTNEWLTENVSDERLLLEEKGIAFEFAQLELPLETSHCPVCENTSVEPFTEIGGVEYFRCCECFSVFASVPVETAQRYQEWGPLLDFRRSERFQSRMSELRIKMWDDLLFWLNFRCARYLQNYGKLSVLDWGNFFSGLSSSVQNAPFCGNYSRRSAVLGDIGNIGGKHNIILHLDQLRHEMRPSDLLRQFHGLLEENGILILSTRVSSGLDILTLKGKIDNVYPYEHAMLPSLAGLELLLSKSGFKLLEVSTPGTMDISNVTKNEEALHDNLFLEYLFKNANTYVLEEFQRFLQKNSLSSHARVIARKD